MSAIAGLAEFGPIGSIPAKSALYFSLDLDLSVPIQLYLLQILCPGYRYLPDDLTLYTNNDLGNGRLASQCDEQASDEH